jgi:hypothetical protein
MREQLDNLQVTAGERGRTGRGEWLVLNARLVKQAGRVRWQFKVASAPAQDRVIQLS